MNPKMTQACAAGAQTPKPETWIEGIIRQVNGLENRLANADFTLDRFHGRLGSNIFAGTPTLGEANGNAQGAAMPENPPLMAELELKIANLYRIAASLETKLDKLDCVA